MDWHQNIFRVTSCFGCSTLLRSIHSTPHVRPWHAPCPPWPISDYRWQLTTADPDQQPTLSQPTALVQDLNNLEVQVLSLQSIADILMFMLHIHMTHQPMNNFTSCVDTTFMEHLFGNYQVPWPCLSHLIKLWNL